MRRLSYEWLDGFREIVIDSNRCPLAFSEFTLKEFERDKEGNWIDDIPDGNDPLFDMPCSMTCSEDRHYIYLLSLGSSIFPLTPNIADEWKVLSP